MKPTSKQLIEYFKLNVVNADKSELNREIIGATLNRAGLQLGGSSKVNAYYKSAVIAWGTREHIFFSDIPKEKRIEVISRAITEDTPVIILSKKYADEIRDDIIQAANSMKIPVVILDSTIGDIFASFSSWVADKIDKPLSIHGSLVTINGLGVIITGPSGIGKSEAVLELIHNEHTFVSDDTVELYKLGATLRGRSPRITKDFLEARGIGLISIPLIYGGRATTASARIGLEVQLVPEIEMNNVDRLGTKELSKIYMNVPIPVIQIPTGTGRSIAILIETAANSHLARKAGVDPLAIIKKRTEEMK